MRLLCVNRAGSQPTGLTVHGGQTFFTLYQIRPSYSKGPLLPAITNHATRHSASKHA